jgi:hypothetical protein
LLANIFQQAVAARAFFEREREREAVTSIALCCLPWSSSLHLLPLFFLLLLPSPLSCLSIVILSLSLERLTEETETRIRMLCYFRASREEEERWAEKREAPRSTMASLLTHHKEHDRAHEET